MGCVARETCWSLRNRPLWVAAKREPGARFLRRPELVLRTRHCDPGSGGTNGEGLEERKRLPRIQFDGRPLALRGLGLGSFGLGPVLHREPTGRGKSQAVALAVKDGEYATVSDLVSRRLAGIGRGDPARKNSEISHELESGMKLVAIAVGAMSKGVWGISVGSAGVLDALGGY
jgi:hypothetical protein